MAEIKRTNYSLNNTIEELHVLRTRLQKNDDKYRESELAYQLISLTMELNKLLKGEFFAPDYIHEKAQTVCRLFQNIA